MDFILEAKNLTKTFSLDAGFFAKADKKVYAVNDVSFGIERGKTYGLVGESGCGKTTTARLLVQMYKANSGSIIYNPQGEKPACDVTKLSKTELREYREKIKYVFQDPSRSLNPRMSVCSILTNAYRYSKSFPGKTAAREQAATLLEEVGLDPSDLDRRPSEFSGGQRQRISIARGLIMKPDVLICDEIVSALDVSIQGQILNLLLDIKNSRNLSFLFIAHDLRVSCYFCDTIGVMYSGMLLEEAPAKDLYKTAAHPYTKLLFEGSAGKGTLNAGEVKTVLKNVTGCPFAHRCPKATEKCKNEIPEWKNIDKNHKARCHYLGVAE
ncbi:oligopeptide/dipeptide ABC transporter ATP-binding protein [Treponema zioleckii]|uniref:oligopeptide/dipeptide ABC transporter ATP-binding protein n=1 Tax=Treponema zioleckii TaxID=331680 RepID=UPI00168B4B7B|nr:ABC transporter ATP-binding protein [Treponema zioleckii]